MLVQFSAENYLSIDNEEVFSLLATSETQHPSHLVPDVPRKGEAVLRAAALYGANGAGKSALVQAMKFAQNFILTGTRHRQAISTRPFKLRKDLAQPSKFEFIFHTQGTLYNYGFRLDASRIIEEWLFATPKTQEVLMFQRTTSKSGKVEVEIGATLTERSSKNRQFLEFVAQGTRPNQLFLTEAAERNVAGIRPIIQWFEQVLVIIPAEVQAEGLEIGMHVSQSHADFVSDCLQLAGTGIDHISTEEIPFEFDKETVDFSEASKEELLQEINSLGEKDILDISVSGGRKILLMRGKNGSPIQIRMKMQHRTKDGHFVTFDIEEESDGTQRLLHLMPALRMLKMQSEKVVVLDELDRRFHTLLSRFFIQTALKCDADHQRSQLIFTTHDTNLLDLDLLRRDEIWFVEKDKGGASHIYSLAEFKVRSDLKIEKGYLNGRFGAIPFASEISNLGWNPKSSTLEKPCGDTEGSAV